MGVQENNGGINMNNKGKELINFYNYLEDIKVEAHNLFGINNNIAEQVNTALQANHALYCQQAIEARLNNLGIYLVDDEWMQRIDNDNNSDKNENDEQNTSSKNTDNND